MHWKTCCYVDFI